MAEEEQKKVDYELDLDVLAPEPRKVKLNGQVIDVLPPRFKNLVALMKLVGKFDSINKDTPEDEALAIIEAVQERLTPIVPALKQPDFDLDPLQLNALIQFVFKSAQPKDLEMLKKAGYSLKDDAQKKTQPGQSDSLPTS